MIAELRAQARIFTLTAALALVLWAPGSARAGDPSSFVPADAVLYLEWAGHDTLQAAEQRSAFAKLMADPEVKRLFTALSGAAHAALGRAGEANEEWVTQANALIDIAKLVWAKGAVFALTGVEASMVGPAPQAVLAIDAGESSAALMGKAELLLKDMAMMTGPTEEVVAGVSFQRYDSVVPLRLGVTDGIVLLTFGEPTAAIVLGVSSGKAPALASSDRFRAAMKKIGTKGRTPVATFHLDVANLLSAAKQVMAAMTGQPEFPPFVEALLGELGVNSIHSVTAAEQIAGSGHRHSIYLAAPAPRKGLLKLSDFEPLTDADLIPIPSDATFAKAVNFRASDAYEEILHLTQALGAVVPPAPAMVSGFIAAAEARIGMKIKEDILDLFDDGWVVFDTPSNGGLIVTGFTMLVETRDADKVDQLVRQGLAALQSMIAPGEGFTVKSYEHAGHRINFVNITAGPSPVAPAWAFHDKRLVMALYPQMVAQTVERLSSSAAASLSILENRDFARARKLLPRNCNSISYFDTKKSVSDLYSIALPLASVGCSMAQKNGVDLDVSLMPRREVFVRDLFADVWGVLGRAE
ncbi:MAG: hypothetical protein ACYSVY_14670 [Planctomycetota bacterium]